MEARDTNSGLRMQGRIDTQIHDKGDLREAADDYDSLSKREKMELAREVEPEYEDTVYNVTTDLLHEYFVDNLDPGNTSAEANVNAGWLGLGTNGGGGTTTADTDLNNRTYEETVTDVADNGKDILASTFLDSTEGNGNTFDEVGLFSGDPANLSNPEVFLINHATFAAVTKDNTKTVTFDVTLTFADA
jgi:hypothetical protein